MITTKNYFEEVENIKPSSLPKKLKEGYDFTKELTEDHTTWEYYKADKDLKSVVDEYLAALNEHLKKNTPAKKEAKKTAPVKKTAKQAEENSEEEEEQAWEAAKDLIHSYVKRGDSLESLRSGQMSYAGDAYWAQIRGGKIQVLELGSKKVNYSFPLKRVYDELIYIDKVRKGKVKNEEQAKPKKSTPEPKQQAPKTQRVRISTKEAKPMERIDEEVKFIKRFVLMHGKTKNEQQILAFINALQRAIVERRIRKTSPYAKEIELIQGALVQMYREMKQPTQVKIEEKVLDKLSAIAGSEKIRLSINYMKRFIGMQGKHIDKEKAMRLQFLIQKAIEKGKISSKDPYMDRIKNVLNSLKFFIEVAKKNETLKINQAVLNGINTALGCGCEKKKDMLSGIEETDQWEDDPEAEELPDHPGRIPPETLINSMDFVDMEFARLGFTGKWLALIGDPCPGFSAMITGRPKYGKSTLALEFAGYLARDHGNVLYVAKEEGLDATLQDKIKEFGVQHPRLTVTGELPQDLRLYDFIFLDSVNTIHLSPDAIQELKAANIGKSFFPVHQTTKAGTFRGDNRHLHNVDSVIELPEKGRAVQYGRFNQGGEMEIFTKDQ